MRLRALRAIESAVGPIPAGAEFIETDYERAQNHIRSGAAEESGPKQAPPAWDHTEWKGDTVVIMAGGPSLTQEQADAVREWRAGGQRRRVIAINTSYRLAPFADVVYACDHRWWTHPDHADVFEKFKPAQLWTQDVGGKPPVNWVRSSRGEGLSRTRGLVHQGANSGFQAIGLAVMWGAKRIILLGFDCHGGHWHGDHPAPLNAGLPHQMWLYHFAKLAPDLAAAGVDVVNCSPGSAIKAFPQQPVMEVLQCPKTSQSAPSDRSLTTDAKHSSPDSSVRATPSKRRASRDQSAISSSHGTATE